MERSDDYITRVLKEDVLCKLIEQGKIILKPVVRKYADGSAIHVARFNGYAWCVANPVSFPSTKSAWEAISHTCLCNSKYVSMADLQPNLKLK